MESCRAAYIAERVAIDGGLCETCGLVPGQIVHHTVWLTEDNVNDPDIALNHALLRLLLPPALTSFLLCCCGRV